VSSGNCRASWLFFGTAGAAYGSVDLSSTFGTLGVQTSSQTSEPRIGYVVGAGFEYLLRPNLTLNFGYQYVDLGRVSVSSSAAGGVFPALVTLGQAASVHAQFQAVTVGMSWRFAPDDHPRRGREDMPVARLAVPGATTPARSTLHRVNLSSFQMFGLSAISSWWVAAAGWGSIASGICGARTSMSA
jgi:hypothetical protein